MGYTVSDFGKTKDGRKVTLYTLTNADGTEASFIDLGAAWVTMKVKDENGRADDVIFGYDSPEVYAANPTFCGECVGRNANRMAVPGSRSTARAISWP